MGYKKRPLSIFRAGGGEADDAANLLPARPSGLMMVLAAYICGFDGKKAWRIFRRDRNKHISPNSAQTESAVAGALHVRLGGAHMYFGKLVEKPCQGDDDRPIKPVDILHANRLMSCACALALTICLALRLAALLLL